MRARLLPVTDPAALEEAARLLREGRLVVFPTETVYGIGANALDERAVRGIFEAKGRPSDNPLIVHLADARDLPLVAREIPPVARRLAEAFWPGPLTLVLPRTSAVPNVTTGGLDSVAVRVPEHPGARELLRLARVPIAAPSANRSGRPSPTRAIDVLEDLGERVDLVLDGGSARVGVESTVLSLLTSPPTLLRPGGLSVEAIEAVIGPIQVHAAARTGESAAAPSPGMRYRHYAPKARLVLLPAGTDPFPEAERLRAEGRKVAVIAPTERAAPGPDTRLPGSREDGAAWAHALFALLRDLDREGYDTIVIEGIPEAGLGLAVMNRLRKAAAGT
ncbi:MAG TPA: L-threonylcarbamoyladenylate synthase [Candidatus Thermoplasmatota archaeon]|nr:L-threonylcarbamoyladenylate synthase [Candidatus Thermoplasmatota archaeon]